jgi:hypothetical protein
MGLLIASALLAQPLAAQLTLPPVHPPFHGGARPLGGAGPGSANAPDPFGARVSQPRDRAPRQGRPRGARFSAIDYFDYAETTPMWTIDSPVTGFGNEALWEDLGAKPILAGKPSTARVASR